MVTSFENQADPFVAAVTVSARDRGAGVAIVPQDLKRGVEALVQGLVVAGARDNFVPGQAPAGRTRRV